MTFNEFFTRAFANETHFAGARSSPRIRHLAGSLLSRFARMKAKTSETKMLLRIRSVGRRMALQFGSILVAFSYAENTQAQVFLFLHHRFLRRLRWAAVQRLQNV